MFNNLLKYLLYYLTIAGTMLCPQSQLLTASGQQTTPTHVATIDSTTTVYNFEVENTHNYFAGHTPVLVHNSCAWRTIRQAAIDANQQAVFKSFHQTVISAGLSASQRKKLFEKIAALNQNRTQFIADFAGNSDALKAFAADEKLFDAWGELYSAGVKNLTKKFDDIEFVGKHHDEIKKSGGYNAWRGIAISADNVSSFSKLTIAQKLENIKNVWKTKYPIPDMLGGRSFFEDIMGQYRYAKSSDWLHTGDISSNFKGIDFYKGTEMGNQIFASTAVSMKTTIVTDVNKWLSSEAIKKNIKFLKEGLSPTLGIASNGKRMFITKAKIHIYMPRKNITPKLVHEWTEKFKSVEGGITFEIKAIENFTH